MLTKVVGRRPRGILEKVAAGSWQGCGCVRGGARTSDMIDVLARGRGHRLALCSQRLLAIARWGSASLRACHPLSWRRARPSCQWCRQPQRPPMCSACWSLSPPWRRGSSVRPMDTSCRSKNRTRMVPAWGWWRGGRARRRVTGRGRRPAGAAGTESIRGIKVPRRVNVRVRWGAGGGDGGSLLK